MRILFSVPAYGPAQAFGGPVEVVTRLAEGLVERGHVIDVFTTSLVDLGTGRSLRSRDESVGGAHVRYLATPLRFRWMGFTPTLPVELERAPRPDVVHVFGFRDPIGTGVAAWCRARRIPYVFEGSGMVAPKHRKVALKRGLDATVFRGVLGGAKALVAASHVEAREYGEASRIVVRPHGFPEPVDAARSGALRTRIGVEADTPLVLYVGRIAHGKGLELLVRAVEELPGAHVAIVGPDDGHGVRLAGGERVHLVGPLRRDELPAIYADADVFALPSSYENFGLVVAEAAAAGAAIVVTDRCGVAELFADRGALVVPYDEAAVRRALERVLGDGDLRRRLGAEARAVAEEWSWARVVELQERIYRQALVA
jgi:glycosyltransferase involved in cell wall biosynthesis